MDDAVPLGPSPRNAWRVSAAHADLVRARGPARPARIEALPKPVTLDLARTAMIVVDMQNDFCHPDGWLASIGVDVAPARAPIAPLSRLLPRLRAAGVPVVFVNWGARPDRANLSPALLHVYDGAGQGRGLGDPGPSGAPTLTEGHWPAAVVDELRPEPGDIRVSKHRMSGFWDTPLDSILRGLDATTLLFAGVNADQCVLHTLADANFLGYDTLLVEDCAATTSPAFCWEATLYNVRQIFGFTVRSEAVFGALA
ncbi:MAG TPA: isochorismatase family cysteine hydrolase [Salinarimonas sp.]|jgi:nicotinamidase-related amidase|nr:isochorismatase family cysteine hydrolase [Salinarimonas sp.]